MHVKHGDDPSTHPKYDLDLWLEAGVISRPDMNHVYGISITTT
jgi:hypothetical protein